MIYSIILLYYAYKRSETPSWAKRIVLGSFAYLLAPLDAIPDLAPFIGFTDDLGILMFGLVSVAGYVDEDVREKSKNMLSQWVKNVDPNILAEVDKRL